jgi:hypothetical protein
MDDSAMTCDNCDGECLTPHGDPDRAVFCCRCVGEVADLYRPKPYRCEVCKKREELLQTIAELRKENQQLRSQLTAGMN